ncbi:hypothetical protein BDN71DRAFT_1556789 [Pleurotus eryngii]|uniref:DNA 3'-5' helicase n=1 Tax=Pleurotus eryngii TaxID=5323 RepID=A0A9P6A6Y3_PLEER|nr:hypothetical protein BDN71DRAFT_1556789 [Pleurotus eryngii]
MSVFGTSGPGLVVYWCHVLKQQIEHHLRIQSVMLRVKINWSSTGNNLVAKTIYCDCKDVVACKQNMAQLSQVGIQAVAISSENNSLALWKEVKDQHYNVLIMNPKILMGNKHVVSLLANTKFVSSILQVVFDEGHCISEWGKFRKGYTQLDILCSTIWSAENIPFYVASATLLTLVLHEISQNIYVGHLQ